MATLNILQIASGREINGALMYCQTLSRHLAAAGHRVTQLCRPGSWLANQPLEGFQRREMALRRFPPSAVKSLATWIRAEGFDVIHTHMSSAHMLGVLAAWQTQRPVVATAHNQYFQLHWRWNDFVIANSQSTARFHQRVNGVPRERIKAIHCLIDLERFLAARPQRGWFVRGEMRLKPEAFVIGVVGDIVARKGQWDAIQALPEIVRRIPQAHLVFVGRFHRRESYVKQMRRFQLRHRLLCRVKWLGIRPNVQDYLAGFNVCLIPSREEPLGMVAAEAQAVGTPVVATRVGGLPEIVQHESTGLLVPPRDPAAIVEAVVRLYHDRKLAETLAHQAKEQVQRMFDPHELTQAVIEIYHKVIESRARQRAG